MQMQKSPESFAWHMQIAYRVLHVECIHSPAPSSRGSQVGTSAKEKSSAQAFFEKSVDVGAGGDGQHRTFESVNQDQTPKSL